MARSSEKADVLAVLEAIVKQVINGQGFELVISKREGDTAKAWYERGIATLAYKLNASLSSEQPPFFSHGCLYIQVVIQRGPDVKPEHILENHVVVKEPGLVKETDYAELIEKKPWDSLSKVLECEKATYLLTSANIISVGDVANKIWLAYQTSKRNEASPEVLPKEAAAHYTERASMSEQRPTISVGLKTEVVEPKIRYVEVRQYFSVSLLLREPADQDPGEGIKGLTGRSFEVTMTAPLNGPKDLNPCRFNVAVKEVMEALGKSS